MPLGSFGNVPDRNASSEELADAFSRLLKEVTYLLNGGLDTLNVNELNADVINAGVLNAMLVVVRAAYASGASIQIDANGIKINDGTKDTLIADTSGNLTLIGRILSSVIIGSEIKTSETAYPRIELSSLNTFFKAFGSATKSIEISVSTDGTPGLFFKDDLGTALLDISSGVFDLLSTIAASISAPNVSAGGNWSFANIITGSITGNAGSANYADRAGTAAASDALAPSGTVAWGQVDKAGSSISQLQTRNLSDLTQTAAYRTVTDGDKTNWNGKANKTQEAWIAPALTSGWSNVGGGQQPAGYMKDEMGFVHLRGLITGGTTGTIFTLPAGYRPPFNVILMVISTAGATEYICHVDLLSDGSFNLPASAAFGTSWLSLDVIPPFRTA